MPTIAKPDLSVEALSDIVTFIESLLVFPIKGVMRPFELYPYQKQIARSGNWMDGTFKLAVCAGRQTGKTLCVAACLVYYAFCYPNISILIASKTQAQSGMCFKHVRNFFLNSPILSKYIDTNLSRKQELILTNSSVIYQRTTGGGTDAVNLRGLSLNRNGILCFDEMAIITDEAIRTCEPIGYGCSTIGLSTPAAKFGYFYEACTNPKLGYDVIRVPAHLCPDIPPAKLETMRATYPTSLYLNDVLAQFSSGSAQVFDATAVANSIDKSLALFDANNFDFDGNFPFRAQIDKSQNYVYSLDCARGFTIDDITDDTFLTIWRLSPDKQTMTLVAYHIFSGTGDKESMRNATWTNDPALIVRYIANYLELFPCSTLWADITTNPYFAYVLQNEYLVNVEPLHWSATLKERMISHLAAVIKAGRLRIPNDSDIASQLLEYSYDTKRMENHSERKIYLAGNRDDAVSSLAMASLSGTANQAWKLIDSISTW